MMGEQKSEPQLFNYAVNLEKRVPRRMHPIRRTIEVMIVGGISSGVFFTAGIADEAHGLFGIITED